MLSAIGSPLGVYSRPANLRSAPVDADTLSALMRISPTSSSCTGCRWRAPNPCFTTPLSRGSAGPDDSGASRWPQFRSQAMHPRHKAEIPPTSHRLFISPPCEPWPAPMLFRWLARHHVEGRADHQEHLQTLADAAAVPHAHLLRPVVAECGQGCALRPLIVVRSSGLVQDEQTRRIVHEEMRQIWWDNPRCARSFGHRHCHSKSSRKQKISSHRRILLVRDPGRGIPVGGSQSGTEAEPREVTVAGLFL